MDKLTLKHIKRLLPIILSCICTNAFAGLENIYHEYTYNVTVGRSIYLSWGNLYGAGCEFSVMEAYGTGNGQITISKTTDGARITALQRTTGVTLVYLNYTVHKGTTWNPHTVCNVYNCWINIVELESVTIPSQLNMFVGESNKLSPVLTPSEASTDYTWHSSNIAVAEVTEEGEIIAKSPGETIITCTTHNGKYSECAVTVNPIKIQSLEVSPSELHLKKNESVQISTTILPENASIKDLEWTSSNEDVAIVSPNGKVVAVNPGVTFVTAKTMDGSNLSAEVTVFVTGNLVTEIALSENDITLAEGQSIKLSATVLPTDADNKSLEWSSNTTTVATVTQDGEITALEQGEAIITAKATDGSETNASCRITVIKPIESISLNKNQLELNINETYNLIAKITPTDATNTTLEWKSSDDNVAMVDNGAVTALNFGKAIITVSSIDNPKAKAICNVIVSNTTNIQQLNSKSISVQVVESNIHINGLDETSIIKIYNSNGKLVYQGTNHVIRNLGHGLYIIIAEDKTFKVMIQ